VAGRASTPYGAVVDLERWFRVTGGFSYSDHPPVVDPPLVGFVTRTRAGYCQYFAGAMALMLRYLGVPARVAVGFSGGTYDAEKGVWDVTDHDAHAWVEAWFRGYGWLPFDPTPAVPGSALAQSLPVSSVSPATPGVSGRLPRGGASLPRAGRTTRSTAPALARHHLGRAAAGGGAAEPAPGVGAPLVLVVLLVVAAAIVGGIAATKLAVRIPGRRERDPRRVATACREELVAFLVDQQLDAAGDATLQELGRVARRHLTVEPEAFVAAATVARFAPAERAGPAAREARRELRSLLRDARRSLSRRERLLGLLSLRSLLAARATVDASASLKGAGS
jgi:Transglutaminase-like superfamily